MIGFRLFVTTIGDAPGTLDALSHFLGIEMNDDPEAVRQKADAERKRFMAESSGFTEEFGTQFMSGQTTMKAIAPVAIASACFASVETIKSLLGRGQVFLAPEYYSLDFMTGERWSLEDVVQKRKGA